VDHKEEMAHGSNDVTWPQTVKILTSVC